MCEKGERSDHNTTLVKSIKWKWLFLNSYKEPHKAQDCFTEKLLATHISI